MIDTKKNKSHGPGGLTSDTSILLHTRQAMMIFDGRKEDEDRPAIYGVPRFSGSVNQIYKDSMADDPWADWWLIKIDDHIDRAKMKLNEYKEEFRELYPDSPSININASESSKPEERPLQFPTPSYAYRMGYLVVEYDRFCCEVLNMAHVGLLTRVKKERYLNLGGKALRAALQSGTGYRHQGVTRNDARANNPKAQKATQLMGKVPDDILNMKRRSDFAPELRQYEKTESTKKNSEATSDNTEQDEEFKVVA